MPVYRHIEVVIFSQLNFLPYMLIAIFPFRNKCCSKKKIIPMMVFLCGLQIFRTYVAIGGHESIITPLATIIQAIFYLSVMRVRIGKSLFTMLTISNLASCITTVSKCWEGLIWPSMALEKYRWTFSLCMAVTEIVVLIPLLFYIHKIYVPAMENDNDTKAWHYLWCIPVTFYIIWYHRQYFSGLGALELALRPANAILLLLTNAGALIVCHVVVSLINEHTININLRNKENFYSMQNTQYKNLQNRMDEMRRARHDLRHHMVVIRSFTEKKQYQQLDEYLDKYLQSCHTDETVTYCSNLTLNAIVCYYSQLAYERQIDFTAKVVITDELSVSDIDITTLFGNILENAFEACTQLTPENRFINLKISMPNSNSFVFICDNSCSKEACKKKEYFISTKHSGLGIGTQTINYVTGKYNGVANFEHSDRHFTVSGVLNL